MNTLPVDLPTVARIISKKRPCTAMIPASNGDCFGNFLLLVCRVVHGPGRRDGQSLVGIPKYEGLRADGCGSFHGRAGHQEATQKRQDRELVFAFGLLKTFLYLEAFDSWGLLQGCLCVSAQGHAGWREHGQTGEARLVYFI